MPHVSLLQLSSLMCCSLTQFIYRLYGLAFHQVYRYYRLYPDDSKYLKGFVRVMHLTGDFGTF